MDKRLLTKKQAANLLSISVRTLERYLAAGVDFGRVRFGRSVRFKSSAVLKLAERGF